MYWYVPVHTSLPDPVQVYRIPDVLQILKRVVKRQVKRVVKRLDQNVRGKIMGFKASDLCFVNTT